MVAKLMKRDPESYQLEDFIETKEPYEYVAQFRDSSFEHSQELERMNEIAKIVGFKKFIRFYKLYEEEKFGKDDIGGSFNIQFSDCEVDYKSGDWYATDKGIYRFTADGKRVVACPHPIIPIRRLTNIDTNDEKLEIAFKRGLRWKKLIIEKSKLSSSRTISQLSAHGVAVTTETAKYLVQYLYDIENLNYMEIPESMAVSRLGWTKDGGFIPYDSEVEFDGMLSYSHMFEAVQSQGDENVWLETVKKERKAARPEMLIAMGSSFASPLISRLGLTPFYTHFYGGTGVGKTVLAMLCASIWGNPKVGSYVQTFNATDVGLERMAGFFNSLPLILDELQIVKDRKNFDETIYRLTEGAGRSRGMKTGGLQQMSTWCNSIISTGEQPMLNDNSGGGASNRVLQIDCDGEPFFEKPNDLVNLIRANHGWAGRQFIGLILDGTIDLKEIELFYKEIFDELIVSGTPKQAIAGALILTADMLAERHIFKDGIRLELKDVSKHLSEAKTISQEARAYEALRSWLDVNANKFITKHHHPPNEIWGKIDDNGDTKIYNHVFRQFCDTFRIHEKVFTKWLKEKGFTSRTEVGSSIYQPTKIDGKTKRCICLHADINADIETMEVFEQDKIPF